MRARFALLASAFVYDVVTSAIARPARTDAAEDLYQGATLSVSSYNAMFSRLLTRLRDLRNAE